MAKNTEGPAKRDPAFIATWPGLGSVASTAGFYLMSSLRMKEIDEPLVRELFDPDHVDVQDGRVRPGRPPAGRFYRWRNSHNRRDIIVYLGESQPAGTRLVCTRLLEVAERLGVKEVYTFAALATDMKPSDPSRVVGVSTDAAGVQLLGKAGVELLKSGRISGLNGVFLAAAAERGMRGIGLLGEMPDMAVQGPYPKASRRVLEVFSKIAGIDVDLTELVRYEEFVDRHLTDLMTRLERTLGESPEPLEEATLEEGAPEFPEPPEPQPTSSDRRRVQDLFDQASRDRSKTFELKRELDRLGLFKEYEDRFLDLFRESA